MPGARSGTLDCKMNETLANTLKKLGIAHRFETLPGGHGFDVVQTAFPEALAFLAENLR